MIVGLIGQAGSGKSTAAAMIAPVHLAMLDVWTDVRADALSPTSLAVLRPLAIELGLADSIKETAMRWWDFSISQLWGPSEMRDAPDLRYPKPHQFRLTSTGRECRRCQVNDTSTAPCGFLSPREALQKIGSEIGRELWPATWIRLVLDRAQTLLSKTRIASRNTRWGIERTDLIVISDVRFVNEVHAIRDAGGVVWRVKRDGLSQLIGSTAVHVSETEQRAQAEEIASLTSQLENNGSFDDLHTSVAGLLREAGL